MLTDLFIAAKVKWQHFCDDESGDHTLVAAVILIMIVVVIAVFFRQQVVDLISNWFNTINEKSSGLSDDV